jgi:alcohol dehydrogenase class IV
MALASLHGGSALANAGLGAVHGFAAPIGGMFHAPHGAICAALLPEVMRCNLETARRQNATEVVRRFDEVARLLTGAATATAEDGVSWVRELCGHLQIPRLAALGLARLDFANIAAKAQQSSSMKGNPLLLTTQQLVEILERAF